MLLTESLDMREDLVVVPLHLLLAFLGPGHHEAADGDVADAEHAQDAGHPPVERQRGGHQQHQRHHRRQMLAHEFQPQREKRFRCPKQRMQRV